MTEVSSVQNTQLCDCMKSLPTNPFIRELSYILKLCSFSALHSLCSRTLLSDSQKSPFNFQLNLFTVIRSICSAAKIGLKQLLSIPNAYLPNVFIEKIISSLRLHFARTNKPRYFIYFCKMHSLFPLIILLDHFCFHSILHLSFLNINLKIILNNPGETSPESHKRHQFRSPWKRKLIA